MRCLGRVCGCLALLSGMSLEAQTATTTKSSSATASFAYLSDDDCVQNDVEVFASQTTVASSKVPKTTMAATYSRHRYNLCEDSDFGHRLRSRRATGLRGRFGPCVSQRDHQWLKWSRLDDGRCFCVGWAGKGESTRLPAPPETKRTGRPTVIRSENLSRGAIVRGAIDGQDISGTEQSSHSLHTAQNTISH